MSEAHKFNENNVYRVRRSTRLNQGIFLSKLILKKHGNLQLEGMGECISLASKISQVLSKNGYTSVQAIQVENIEKEDQRGINPKITIKLNKTVQFDKLTEDIVLRE